MGTTAMRVTKGNEGADSRSTDEFTWETPIFTLFFFLSFFYIIIFYKIDAFGNSNLHFKHFKYFQTKFMFLNPYKLAFIHYKIFRKISYTFSNIFV